MKVVKSKREVLWEEIDTNRCEVDNKKETLIDNVEKYLGKKLANRNYLR